MDGWTGPRVTFFSALGAPLVANCSRIGKPMGRCIQRPLRKALSVRTACERAAARGLAVR